MVVAVAGKRVDWALLCRVGGWRVLLRVSLSRRLRVLVCGRLMLRLGEEVLESGEDSGRALCRIPEGVVSCGGVVGLHEVVGALNGFCGVDD